MEKQTKEFKTVHELDLIRILEKMGLLQDFQAGLKKCKFCGEIVTESNIYSLLPEADRINFICDKPDCIKLLLEYLDEKKKGRLLA